MTDQGKMSDRPELSDFLSGDPHRIWLAAGATRICSDRAHLRELAGHVDQIARATRGIDLGGAFVRNASHLALALRILRFVVESDDCLCRFFPEDRMYDAHHLARAGRVRILSDAMDRETWEQRYRVECTGCAAQFDVTEQTGWHVPLWTWTKNPG